MLWSESNLNSGLSLAFSEKSCILWRSLVSSRTSLTEYQNPTWNVPQLAIYMYPMIIIGALNYDAVQLLIIDSLFD